MTGRDLSAGVLLSRAAGRRRMVLIGTMMLVAGLFVGHALLGSYAISFADAIRMLGGAELGLPNYIFLESKLPRALAGLAAGLALGAAGAASQAMLRNPIASPDVMGITLGASTAAVTALVVFRLSSTQVSLAALLGALVVSCGLLLISRGEQAASNRMILVGIGMSAALEAVIHWVLISANTYQAHDALVWLSGSLNSLDWSGVTRLWSAVAIGLPVLFLLERQLNTIAAGDDLACGLGVIVSRVRILTLLVVVMLCAMVTSVCGPVSFIGLLSGPVARALNAGRSSLQLASFTGALIVLGADWLGESELLGDALPVGVITGFIGAPMLVLLLLKTYSKEGVHG